MKRDRWIAAGVAGMTAAAVFVGLLARWPASAAEPVGTDEEPRIVFSRLGGASTSVDLWIMSEKGRALHRLTDDPAHDETHAAASPDGRSIAYVRANHGSSGRSNPDGSDIYVMDLATGQQRALAADPSVWEYRPAWSPDGNTIAYSREVPPGVGPPTFSATVDVYVVNVHDEVPVPKEAVGGVPQDNFPAWSPSGTAIAHSSIGEGGQSIVETDLQSGARKRHALGALNGSPAWGKGARSLLFQGYEGDLDLYEVTAGGNRMLFDTDDAHERFSTWAPDGRSVAYASVPIATCGTQNIPSASCAAEIWTVDLDSMQRTRLTQGAADGYPAFVPAVTPGRDAGSRSPGPLQVSILPATR